MLQQARFVSKGWRIAAATALACSVSLLARAAPVYYSVGTAGATDRQNGPTQITITGGTATFTLPQPDNVGLGDEITFGATKVYISGRVNASTFTVTTRLGATPTDVSGVNVDSITRAFPSLSAATTGSSDASHLNSSNLVSLNVQLNWVCYNDGPDTTRVAIQEPWTTGPANYIRVFTPTSPSEVGVSQRHKGVAGTGYRLAPTETAGVGIHRLLHLSTNNGYIRVEGIEIDGSNFVNGEWVHGIDIGDSSGTFEDVRVSSNLIYNITNSTVQDTDQSDVWGINVQSANNTKVWNNVIYNITNVSMFASSDAKGIESNTSSTTHYIYNNTVYGIRNYGTTGEALGIEDDAGSTFHAFNNYVGLVESPGGTAFAFNGTFASAGNNVSFDGTAPGAGSQTGQASYVTYFFDVTPGSVDLHLRSDSNTLWGAVGADLDTDPNAPVTDDIDRQPRDAATPDIGADEFSGDQLTLADHTLGQVGDAFTTTSPVTATLFRFRLSRVGLVTVENLRVRYTTGSVIDADVTGGELWRDVNGDGVGDVLLQSAVAGAGGALAFVALGEDPGAGTDYVVRATVANLISADSTTFSLGFADVDLVEGGVLETGAVSNATHTQDTGPGFEITGTVSEDVDGDGDLADGVPPAGANVLLYQDGGDGQPDGVDDVFLSLSATDVAGAYGFVGLSGGTYWVVVDSKTFAPNAGLNVGSSQGDVWPEQTRAGVGGWCDDGTGTPVELGAPGRCFGGRVATSSDDAWTLSSAEHLSRVVVAANVGGVDFAFSFQTMVHTLGGDAQDDDPSASRTVQGSLRQFIQNASAVMGANALRFVPRHATNATDGGGNDWWRVTVTAALPAVTDDDTTIDGRAHSSVDGVTPLDTNPTLLGYVGPVGLGPDALLGTADELSLSGVAGPELEIVNDRATNVLRVGLDLQASSVHVRRIAIYGFGLDNLFTDGNVRIGIDSGGTNFTGVVLEHNVIGSSAASFTDPGVADRTLVNDVAVFGADTGTIQNNLIGFAGRFGVFLSDTAVGWTVQANELRANDLQNNSQDGLDIGNGSSGTNVSGNLFVVNGNGGIDSYRGLGNNTIENNTFTQNGVFGVEPSAMRLFGSGNTVRFNDIDTNSGPGVLIVSDLGQTGSPAIQNHITRNRFSGNGGNAIDLLALGGDASLGDGITLNDAATDPQAGNIGLDYPVIDSAVFIAGTTTVTGTTCPGCDVEVYKASAGAGDTLSGTDYGEGIEYLGVGTADGAGAFSVSGITSLSPGDDVSAIAIDPSNNTSEFSGNVTVSNGVTLTMSDHSSSQVGNRFLGGTPITDLLFRFRLARSGTVTVSQLRVNFTTAGGVADGDVSAGELWEDVNDDGIIDGGDSLIEGAVAPAGGVLTFSTAFSPQATGTGYLVGATVANLTTGDTTTFSVGAADVDLVEGGVNEVGAITNAVHTQAGLRTVYYSVGTSAADFKNGSPLITITSGVATLTTSQPANVGVGDEITYNGTSKVYISGRTSGSVYTVTTATGNVPADVASQSVDAIRRAFNSLSAAQTGSSDVNHLTSADLAANNVQLNWACYNDPTPMDDMVDINGWTTGPTNYLRIFTPTGSSEVGVSQRHTGVAGTGFRIAPVTAVQAPYNVIYLRTGYVRIEGIEIDGSGITNAEYVRGILVLKNMSNVGEIHVSHSILHDLHTRAGTWSFEGSMGIMDLHEVADAGPPMYIHNNVIYDVHSNTDAGHIAGILIGSRTTSYVYNNTIFNIFNEGGAVDGGPAWGLYTKSWPGGTGSAVAIATNNYCGDVRAPQDPVARCYDQRDNGVLTQSHNVSSDATAAGPNSQTGLASYASYFENVTAGSEDLHLVNDSLVLWGSDGADLDSDPNLSVIDDIDGEPRDASRPDIGADESRAAVNYRSIGAYSTGVASIAAATSTVNFANGASLPADVQAGDQLVLDPGGANQEIFTIVSRVSAIQATVTGPATLPHFSEPYLLYWRYTTGNASIAINTTTVTFGGGASLPAKMGLGDRLVIGGETFHVLTRDSATQATVASPATSSHVSAGYTLQRAYQTLQGWEDDRDGALVAENRTEVGVAYDDGPFDPPYASANSALIINGSTTDPGHYMRLTAASGNRHDGRAGTGVLLDGQGVTKFGIQDQDDYTRIDFLELARFKKAGDSGFASIVNAAAGALYSHLLIYDFQEGTVDGDGVRVSAVAGGWSFTLRNSIIYAGDRSAVRVDEASSSAVVENVTIHDMDSFGVALGGGGGTITVTNTIATDSGTSFNAGSGTLNQSYNLSSDLTAAGTGSLTGRASIDQFVSTILGSEDLHLKAGADAIDTGQNLSGSFCCDIDNHLRVDPWDIGADDLAATTEVELLSFEAAALDGAVALRWKTGSEIRNLGFNLYRATAEDGTYERVNGALIPGLGSSPEGASYAYRDSDLVNGTEYFYLLEDVETTGRTERHGPVSVVPGAAGIQSEAEPSERGSRITYGDPSGNRFEVVSWDSRGAVVALVTEGFYAEPLADGSVLLEIPGFERTSDDRGPAVPVHRPWVEAIAGVGVEIVSVDEQDRRRFASLVPSGAESYEATANDSGVVRSSRRVHRASLGRASLFPEEAARILSTGFQGDVKKVQLELAPLRWSGSTRELLLSRKLLVRLAFRGKARNETATRLGRGYARRSPRRVGSPTLARFATSEAGLHAVRYETLFGRRGRSFDATGLRLSRLGEPVAIHLEPDPMRFGPGSTLYFLSPGPEVTPYGNELVFELASSPDGMAMGTADASPGGSPVRDYENALHLEVNRFYQAGIPDAEHWFWDVIVSSTTKTFDFEVTALADTIESGRIRIRLQGLSDFPVSPDHHLRLYVNGALVGESTWEGKTAETLEAPLPPGILVEGVNTLALENVADTEAAYSVVFLDGVDVDYMRRAVLESGTIEGTWRRSGSAIVTGGGPEARVIDTTDESRPVWLTGLAETAEGELVFRADENRRYRVASPASVLTPAIRPPATNALVSPRHDDGADYLLIGPAAFRDAAEPLVELRREQGLSPRFVAIEQVQDELGFGEPRPEALRDFLAHVYHEWPEPRLRYVVLLGDATFDYKDFLETGVTNQVPPLMRETSHLWTASDPTFAMVNGDDRLPDVAIGRLPARNTEELRVMVAKILAFESGSASFFSGPFFLVADDPDEAGDFVGDAREIERLVPSSQRVERSYLSELGAARVREDVLRAFDGGSSIVSYIGHGGIDLWADESLLTSDNVPFLAPQAQQPLLLTMNCLNGYFHFPHFDSLSELLVKAEDRGAVAAFSPSGLSLDAPAHRYHRALVRALLSRDHERLGDALLAAQYDYAASGSALDLLAIFHLFGDPALTLK